jgi:nitrogen fixation/metabolism regulation signal transduction histidine kinase
MKVTLGKLGQRSESRIVLPAALVILALLSTFTLFSYRGTIQLLLEERQAEAKSHASRVSQSIAGGRLPSRRQLRQWVPLARGVAIVNGTGAHVVEVGELAEAGAQSDFRHPRLSLIRPHSGVVTGTARLRLPAQGLTVRVDLPAPILRSRGESLRILSLLVLGVNAAVLVLVLFFLNHFLAPFDRMIERVRGLGGEGLEKQDEVEHLVEIFESALAALAKPQELVELEALGRTFASSLESGVLLCDRHGAVLALNAIGAGLLGITEPAPGTTLENAFGALPELEKALTDAMRQKQTVQRREVELRLDPGETRTLGLTVHPLRREGGQVRGFLALFADLTTAQRLADEQRLSDSLTQVGELAAGVAHELRNSLATLRGYLSLIERDHGRNSWAEYLAEVRLESDHLQRVLEDFLTFARPGSVRMESLDLLHLTRRAAADPALSGVPIEITLAAGTEAEDYTIQGDSQLLERALRNLLHNAAAAQEEIGVEEPLGIGLSTQGDKVRLTIEDRGTGLPADHGDKLFDPFVSERPGGVGLGLALTRRILLLHRGQIELSDREQGGARAMVSLPSGKPVTKSSRTSKNLLT